MIRTDRTSRCTSVDKERDYYKLWTLNMITIWWLTIIVCVRLVIVCDVYRIIGLGYMYIIGKILSIIRFWSTFYAPFSLSVFGALFTLRFHLFIKCSWSTFYAPFAIKWFWSIFVRSVSLRHGRNIIILLTVFLPGEITSYLKTHASVFRCVKWLSLELWICDNQFFNSMIKKKM